MNNQQSTELKHSSSCTSSFLSSIYDKTCPRCAVISKVIAISRRASVHLGASVEESKTATSLAESLRIKHGLSKVEVLDRMGISPLNQLKVVEVFRRKTNQQTDTDDLNGLEGEN